MNDGLEGVIAAETVLSHIDGERGSVWVRGHSLEDLVTRHGYEGAIAILWEGFAGTGLDRARVLADLGAARADAFRRLDGWLPATAGRPMLEGTRLCLAALPDGSTPAGIVGGLAVGLAALLRARDGARPVAPDPALDTATDLLRMWHGAPVEDRVARALETYFTAFMEHGLSASNFTARVVASTHASLASAVVGAYAAFTGPRHGGAPRPVAEMLDEIAASGDVDGWIERRLAAGERLMGFGHRVLHGRDARTPLLRAALDRLGPDASRLALAEEVARRARAVLARVKPGRSLEPNIELVAAVLLDAIGIPREAFTPVFTLGRTPGWLAHAMEHRKTGRMIRPSAAYVGPPHDP